MNLASVNGRPLSEPALLPFAKGNQGVKIDLPKIGEAYSYIDYETGGFRDRTNAGPSGRSGVSCRQRSSLGGARAAG